MRVGQQRDVVVAVPGDVAELPGVGQAAEVVGRFEQRDALAALGQAEGERQAEHAAADDAQMFARVHDRALAWRQRREPCSLRRQLSLTLPTADLVAQAARRAGDRGCVVGRLVVPLQQRLAAAADAADRAGRVADDQVKVGHRLASRPSPCRPWRSGRSSGRCR